MLSFLLLENEANEQDGDGLFLERLLLLLLSQLSLQWLRLPLSVLLLSGRVVVSKDAKL